MQGYFQPADLDGLFEVRNYLGNADEFVRDVLARANGAAGAR
jgi:hypothetical protein